MPKLTQDQLAERWHMSPRTLEQWRWLGNALQDFLSMHGEEVCLDLGSGEELNVTAAAWTAFISWGANCFDLPDTSRKRRALKNALSQLEDLGLIATSSHYVWLVD